MNVDLQQKIALCKKARRQFHVGDRVRALINDSSHWSHPTLYHQVTIGGIITDISPYCLEIDVKWLQTGLRDHISPLDIIPY